MHMNVQVSINNVDGVIIIFTKGLYLQLKGSPFSKQ